MGLLDREYYREDEGGPLAAWFRIGLVTKILVATNVLFFLIQVSSAPSGTITSSLAVIGDRIMAGQVWRLITHCFLHPTDSLFPILFNLTVLWVAGRELESRLGTSRFLAFYLLSAMMGGLAFMTASRLGWNGAIFDQTRFVGATAPLTGLLVLLVLQSPRQRLLFFYALPAPVWLILVVAVAVDAYGLVVPGNAADGRRLTLAAHLGAALYAVLVQITMRKPRPKPSRRGARPKRDDSDLRIYRDDPPQVDDDETPAPVPASSDVDEHLEAQLDAVLAKVAQHGQERLTSAERAVLQRASEVYRKRRQ